MWISLPGVPGILKHHHKPSGEERSCDLFSEEVKGIGKSVKTTFALSASG
jgi:hypothetical protein